MDTFKATEIAYKNGYDRAVSEMVHCDDCEHFDKDWTYIDGAHMCKKHKAPFHETDYCNYGKRRV